MNNPIKEKIGQLPSAEQLEREIHTLEFNLARRDESLTVRQRAWYQNAIRRRRKMLAAVKDGRPWAWPEYDGSCSRF